VGFSSKESPMPDLRDGESTQMQGSGSKVVAKQGDI
jgi:hypothetical protein